MERRLTAILAADVVGYSRLMEADEVGVLGKLKAHREELINPGIARGSRWVVRAGALASLGRTDDRKFHQQEPFYRRSPCTSYRNYAPCWLSVLR